MRYVLQTASALILLGLAACAPTVQEWRDYGDDASCASYGITPADPGYAQCRAVFAQARAQQQQNAMNALTNHGGYLPNQALPYVFAEPVGIAPPYLANCRTTGAVIDCYSQIY